MNLYQDQEKIEEVEQEVETRQISTGQERKPKHSSG